MSASAELAPTSSVSSATTATTAVFEDAFIRFFRLPRFARSPAPSNPTS
jgi:hypothetical protein